MSEYQEVVDELRFVLQRDVIEQSQQLTDLVARYSQYCHDVNVRLRRCDDCIKQGLRSEALHLADSKPNLLEAIAVLDFPERQELIDVLGMYSMAVPEPLLIEVATSLNEAYAEHEPLEKLLNQHRLLALARAPLSQRLEVLRSLAELDSASQFWDEDIRELEAARFRELESEAVAAAKTGDSALLKTLSAEIQTTDWRSEVPNSLRRGVKSRTSQVVRENARQRITELNDQLYAAFSALDAAQARPLRDEWLQRRQQCPLDDNDPLVEFVSPVLEWLNDEDRKASDEKAFTQAVTAIERAIDHDDVTADELKRLKRTAERYQRALPSLLDSRFRSRLGSLEVNERRRKTLMIGTAAAACLLVAGIFGFFIHVSMEGAKTRRLVAATQDLINDGKLNEAKSLFQQHGAQSASEAWLEVRKRLSDVEKAEELRVSGWNAQLNIARENADLNVVETALKQAREFTKTADEKMEVDRLQAAWESRANEALAAREQKCRQMIAEASTALKSLDAALVSLDADDVGHVRPLQEAAERPLLELTVVRNTVSQELASQINVLETRFKSTRQALDDLTKKSELIERLTEAVLMLPENSRSIVQPERYEAVLNEFLTALPHEPLTASAKTALESNPFPARMGLQKLIKRWIHLKPTDQHDVESRLKDIREYLTEFPQSPDCDAISLYELWLKSILLRFESEGDPDDGAQRRMVALFNHRFIKDALVLEDKDGSTYYLKSPPKIGSTASFEYVIGFNGETRAGTLKTENLIAPKAGPPAHQEIAAKARTMFRNVPIDHWREHVQELLETLLKEDKVDAFVRYLLILKTVELAGYGDHFLKQELDSFYQTFNDEEIDRSVPWMDPKNSSARAARERAAEVLAKHSSDMVGPLITSANRNQSALEQTLMVPRFSVGWLERRPNGIWDCHKKWVTKGDYALFVVAPPDKAGKRSWLSVGNVRSGAFVIDPAAAQSVGELAVVFASPVSTDTKTAQVPHR